MGRKEIAKEIREIEGGSRRRGKGKEIEIEIERKGIGKKKEAHRLGCVSKNPRC